MFSEGVTIMLTLRMALLTIVAVVLTACGSVLGDSDDVISSLPDPDPQATTTTVPSVPEIEDPPLPTAPPTTSVPDPTANDDDSGEDFGDTEVAVFLVVEPNSGIDGYDFGCGLATPVVRRVQSPKMLSEAIQALLAGPTADERDAGYGSVFFAEVGWEVGSVTITDGIARIDFSEDSQPIANMSTSCVNMALMAQLEMTATQFPTVDAAVFSIGGDVATFYHWLERDVPEL